MWKSGILLVALLLGCNEIPPSPFYDLNAIWGLDANHIWAVGEGGLIKKWDGAAWSLANNVSTQDFNDVWGSDANHAWAVGFKGTIWHWNGMTWTPQNSGT